MTFRVHVIDVLTRLTRVEWMVKFILGTLFSSHHHLLSEDYCYYEDHRQNIFNQLVICMCTSLLNSKKFFFIYSTLLHPPVVSSHLNAM